MYKELVETLNKSPEHLINTEKEPTFLPDELSADNFSIGFVPPCCANNR